MYNFALLTIISLVMGCAEKPPQVELDETIPVSEPSADEPSQEPSSDTGSADNQEPDADTGENSNPDTGEEADTAEDNQEDTAVEEEPQQSDLNLDLGNGIVLNTVVIPAGSEPFANTTTQKTSQPPTR